MQNAKRQYNRVVIINKRLRLKNLKSNKRYTYCSKNSSIKL